MAPVSACQHLTRAHITFLFAKSPLTPPPWANTVFRANSHTGCQPSIASGDHPWNSTDHKNTLTKAPGPDKFLPFSGSIILEPCER